MPFATLSDFFRGLFGPVGNGRENEADDVVRVKTAMRRLGYYDAPSYGMTGYIDRVWMMASEPTSGRRVCVPMAG
jgi:hypothetical protein